MISWHALLWLASAEGLAALVWLASLPSDSDTGRFLGFSSARLLLMAFLLALSATSAVLAVAARRMHPVPRSAANGLLLLLPFTAAACGLVPSVLMMVYRTSGEFRFFAYYQRLLPLCLWGLLVSLQGFGLLLWKGDFHWLELRAQIPVFRAALWVLLVIAFTAVFVLWTGIGRDPDVIGWGGPTVSLMEWQVWLGWGAASLLMLLLARIAWKPHYDRLLPVAIWLLAVVIWLGQPIRPAFFATAGRAPNYEIYPFSDGAYYDHFAQSALIGNGFKSSEIPARPMYVTLLVGFHLLAGQGYEHIIFVQTLLLALFPVVVYLLGKELHSRAAGILAALLAILREMIAAYAMPFTNNASNSKLLFADLPTALAVSLWVLLVVRWLKSLRQEGSGLRLAQSLLVGGSLGLAMLFRTQAVFMLPGILLLALFAGRFRWRSWLQSSAVVFLGLALVLSPWLVRNAALTGRLAFDDDKSQTGVMAQRYSLSGQDESFVYRPGEDLQAFSNRSIASIFKFLFTHPGDVARFVTGHFLNAEVDNLLVLPVRFQLPGLRDLLLPSTAFWESGTGAFPAGQAVILLLNLGVIALGIGAGWARFGWAGLAPLVIQASYHLSNALARNSGGRYLLVVDWVLYFYAAMGFLEITLALMAVLGVPTARRAALLTSAQASSQAMRLPVRRARRAALLAALALVLAGSLPFLADRGIPARYADQTQPELAGELARHPAAAQAGVDSALASRLASMPGMLALKGRVLYPRFYAAGDGEPRTAKTGYEPLDYARTVMVVTANTYNGLAILKTGEAPRFLPNAADVIFLGCPGGNYMDVRLMLVLDGPGAAYRAGEDIFAPCPSHAETAP